jgi:hypothetical protein
MPRLSSTGYFPQGNRGAVESSATLTLIMSFFFRAVPRSSLLFAILPELHGKRELMASAKQQWDPMEEPLVPLLQQWLERVVADTENDSADYRRGYIAGFSCAAGLIDKHRQEMNVAN